MSTQPPGSITDLIRWPTWITPSAKRRIIYEIQFAERGLTGEFSPTTTEQVGREAAAAMEATREIRKRIKNIMRANPMLDQKIGGHETLKARGRMINECEDDDCKRALSVGFDLRLAHTALAGVEQKMKELEEISKPGKGRKRNYAAADLALSILEALEPVPDIDTACRTAFLDHVFSLIQEAHPGFERPSMKTISRHRDRVEREAEQLRARVFDMLNDDLDWTK